MPSTRNIIIFAVIAVVLIFGYFFFFGSSSTPQQDIVTSSNNTSTTAPTGYMDTTASGTSIAPDFLYLLLSVSSIKLNDGIFSDTAFASLRDSSITLTPDTNTGRPNPFAQFGNDIVAVPTTNTTPTTVAPATPPASSPVNPASAIPPAKP